MTKANAGAQNFGHRHLNIRNRYSLCNNPCRSHRHLLVHGSRKDFSRLRYKRCHLLRPDPTSNRHSRHGSKSGLVLIDHRASRLQHSKEYSDCGKAQQGKLEAHEYLNTLKAGELHESAAFAEQFAQYKARYAFPEEN